MTGNMNYNPNYATGSPLLAGGKQLAHGWTHHQNFGKEIVRPARKPLREETQADYGLIPHKKSSCQHELQSKVSLLRNRVEITNQNTASKKPYRVSEYNSKQTFLTSFPVDITATTGNLLTSTSVTPTVAKRPISDGPMWVPFASTHSPLLMSCPMGLKIRTEKQHERETE